MQAKKAKKAREQNLAGPGGKDMNRTLFDVIIRIESLAMVLVAGWFAWRF